MSSTLAGGFLPLATREVWEFFLNQTFKLLVSFIHDLFEITGHSVMLGFEIYDKSPKLDYQANGNDYSHLPVQPTHLPFTLRMRASLTLV